ncbi:hypothetical protein [Micromonospora sp. NPDC049497]|uniref:hypothetical protein n=1 Tax=Micromonospora sp. NPDC049497 TaxID=3364273 RepID=UPI0037AB7F2B
MDEERPARQRERSNFVPAGRALLCVLLISTTLVVLALQTASGVTHLEGSSYNTEFAEPTWWLAGFLLFVPVYLASRRYPKLAVVAVIAAVGPQFALPAVVVDRYVEGGWGDGLEGFGYVLPILMTPVFAVAAAAGAAIGWRKQRAHDA